MQGVDTQFFIAAVKTTGVNLNVPITPSGVQRGNTPNLTDGSVSYGIGDVSQPHRKVQPTEDIIGDRGCIPTPL